MEIKNLQSADEDRSRIVGKGGSDAICFEGAQWVSTKAKYISAIQIVEEVTITQLKYKGYSSNVSDLNMIESSIPLSNVLITFEQPVEEITASGTIVAYFYERE